MTQEELENFPQMISAKMAAQQELINVLYSQVIDLSMMSKIELDDDVIAEIKRLKEIIRNKEIIIYEGEANYSRSAYIKLTDNKVIFDCSDEEYGPIEFNIELLKIALSNHEQTESKIPIYSEIENLIITWNIDGTKTAGSLTREIIKLIESYE